MRRIFACLLAAAAIGCTDLAHDDLFISSDASGSLNVPLTGSDAAGRNYQLRGATFEVNGGALVTLNQTSKASHTALQTPLPEGHYQIFLRPGYELVEVAADGTTTPVAAALSTPNPAPLQLHARSARKLHFSFRRSDQNVVIEFGAQANLPTASSGASPQVLASAHSGR